MGKKNKLSKYPFVSVCTPTFNRRPFIPIAIKCFQHQLYPKDKIEWIIVDDGTDKIEDLVTNIEQVKYFKYDTKLTLGKKRNICNSKAKGDIIVYMDDDDYYPPERIQHAVSTLRDSKALCAGSSTMFMHFKHINKMLQFGPYGDRHSTAATFAFKRELLTQTSFDEQSSVAEERHFLKNYTIPFVQLDPQKTILVFSHIHNSFDKKQLLKNLPNPHVHETTLLPEDIIKEEDIFTFFMKDIDTLLEQYEPGNPSHKQDVLSELTKMETERNNIIEKHMKEQQQYKDTMEQLSKLTNAQTNTHQLNEQAKMIQELTIENNQLKQQIKYLNDKITQLIQCQISQKRETRES